MKLDEATLESLGKSATSIVEDYDNRRPPFESVVGITTPITDKIEGKCEKALFLTLTSALNRRRDAEQLYTKFERLYYDEHWIFEPETLIEDREFQDLADLFEDEGTRFGRRDAEYWYEIARTLYEEYNSNPVALLEACDHNAERLEMHVRSATGDTRFFEHGKKFPGLRGDKIRPLWLRLLSNQVQPLGAKGGSDVSVDTHVLQITNRTLGTEFTNSTADKEEVRQIWRKICANEPIDPVDIDGPLWYINRDWSDWGRAYVSKVFEDAGLELQADGVEATPERRVPHRSEYESKEAWINAVAEAVEIAPRTVRGIIEQSKQEH